MDGIRVLLLGGSGLVGRETLRLLVADERFGRIVALSRRPLPEIAVLPKVEVAEVDFDRLADAEGVMGADVVVVAFGTTLRRAGSREAFRHVDFSHPFTVARIAHKHGATNLVLVSSAGAGTSRGFYFQVKGELETSIRHIGYRSLTILRPSLLLGERAEFRLGETIGQFAGRLLSFALPARIRPVPARDVARAIVAAAANGSPGVRIVESDAIARVARGEPLPPAAEEVVR